MAIHMCGLGAIAIQLNTQLSLMGLGSRQGLKGGVGMMAYNGLNRVMTLLVTVVVEDVFLDEVFVLEWALLLAHDDV